MALYLIVVQAHFVMNNIFEGMIWFFLPVSLVIVNDIFAYVCGMTFGRTPLIKLSPKKTVEGFVGAWIFTILAGILFTSILSRYDYFICPVNVSYPSPVANSDRSNNCRTSVRTFSPASTASPILFSPLTHTTSPHGYHLRPPSRRPSPSPQYSSTFSSSPLSRR